MHLPTSRARVFLFVVTLLSPFLVDGAALAQQDEGAAELNQPQPDPFYGPLSHVAEAHAEEAPLVPPTEVETEPSAYHLGIDVSWQSLRIRYLTPIAIAAPDCACGMADVSSHLLRGALSVGWSGISIEASIARAVAVDEPFYVWTAGLRLDTAYRGTLSLGIRMSYVRRTGAVTGTGGRFSALLQIRFLRQLVVYGEAGVDVLDVPGNDAAVFSYAPFYGVGVRTVVGR